MDAADVHRRARQRGEGGALYGVVWAVVAPFLRVWFRMRIHGAEHVPAAGPAIIAPNHKGGLDPFFIAAATRRPVRFMAKTEMFRGPLTGLLPRLGAFPVQRGAADAEAIATARAILEQGGVVVIFPEGTRVEDPHALGSPHHGAGRLALDSGAPVVPAAITGSDHLWLGPLLLPRRVQLSFAAPLDPSPFAARPEAATELVDAALWPSVREQYERQLATPGVIIAALTGLGLGGGLLVRRRRRGTTRLLGFVPPRNRRRRRRRWPLPR